MNINQQSLLELMYQALAAPAGIVISVSDFPTAQRNFYSARAGAADPELACLQFQRSPVKPDTEAWITKRGAGTEAKSTNEGEALTLDGLGI